ncbi:Peroxisome size and maintenance regulator [Friedmanniomyces endolithicus]|uniref:Peroxisome size and maintenance regulator n=1 Tax=Friedmanniomyces endolithicus TaxID=329885 RepID=A0AAN6KF34_9PEZI|nr:Peroxisome size and maintenance regulator [Friedmanniomyces endolithicus]KAK0798398.1 Peroxisome size and maintenance regulator [Friedmanniomyces endolithicus]KAK0862825.1 Peroxisome size and maintenance regulator [Friedmanniomyces endolithicus]KAK0881300.1 Peroxisome size and maintenance regulator [Friedmanniomyces endolithicus]KAK0904377.1 Peroxisome size and maintenance regulator [Friedmanniomyces endolithicus]
MDDKTPDTFVNRDEAIPVIKIPSRDDAPATPEQKQRTRDRLKEQATKLKGKLEEYGTPETRQSIQDRFLNGIMSQIIPPDDLGDNDSPDDSTMRSPGTPKDRRSRAYVARPNFSLPLMTANFRRFNARVGIIFVLQNRLIHLFTWARPSATLSFLAVYSLLCMQPHLLPVLPLAGLLFSIMVPSFLARHPAPANDPRVEASYWGPSIAPPSRVKPVPELSKDFFRNMRDLQNSMDDFSTLHDAANEYITPYTNFSSEMLSSTLFTLSFLLACLALTASHLIPWRFVALLAGWTATALSHPQIQHLLLSPPPSSNLTLHLRQHLSFLHSTLITFTTHDILLDAPPPRREVEIFELQHYDPYSDSWEPWLFTPTPYDPSSPLRMAGATTRPRGTRFFGDVEAPGGWGWKGKKWGVDLEGGGREWVEGRGVGGVEVELGGEGWVYDLEVGEEGMGGKGGKGGRRGPKSGWEEGGGGSLEQRRGEWRRRRWVREVERLSVGGEEKPG